MSDKQLKNKTIKIKGKDYVMVKDRLIYFNETYPEGAIQTELISEPTSELIIIKATVYPDKSTRCFTGYSQAIVGGSGVNATAALENCETSAVGRALAMMGIGVLDSVASADEINKSSNNTMKFATPKQIDWIRKTAHEVNDQLGGDEETDDWIETILTIRPAQVPIYKVKDAVDKLKEKPTLPDPDIELTEEQMNEALDKLENGELPY